MKMQLKNLLSRLLFCLPFIGIVLYIHSYHGEMVNNSKVEWQYVKSDDGKTYLALDVYAPSGIKIDSIFSHSKNITTSWNLINYPDWYKGKNNFDKLSEFQEVLHPCLPYHDDADTLYTTEWYTFLYEWKASDSFPMPSESSISIKYQNIGTENYYSAYHVTGIRLISNISKSKVDSPVIDVQMLYPLSYSDKDEVELILDNLTPFHSKIKDMNAKEIPGATSSNPNYPVSNLIDGKKGTLWGSTETTDDTIFYITRSIPYKIQMLEVTLHNNKGSHLRDVSVIATNDKIDGGEKWHKIRARIGLDSTFSKKISVPNEKDGTIIRIELDVTDPNWKRYKTFGLACFSGSEGYKRNYVAVGNGIYVRELAVYTRGSLLLKKFYRDSSNYALEDLSRKDYSISIQNETGYIVDSLKGFVSWDSEKVCQVYSKTRDLKGGESCFNVILQHLAAIAFIIYFVFVCRGLGLFFIRCLRISLTTSVSNAVISVFVGIIILTYLFFVVGLFKILYFPIVFAILVIILFLFSDPLDVATSLKKALINQLNAIKKNPFRILPLMVLLALLFYNLSYCFIPATFQDGSGDIVNSYLPNLNHYIISHSFEVPIDNSTTGIIPQAFEVLRAVMMMFAGEPGVYLLSIVYLVLMLGGVYLIGKELFEIKSMLIYITVLLLLSSNLFTEGIHLGKLHPAALSFLLISLYSSRFSDHKNNYILPGLFFAFLTSQFIFFGVVSFAYYLFIFSYSFYNHRTIKAPVFGLHLKSLIVFCLLCFVFNLKLIIEVGIFLPPGMAARSISDFFLNLNQNNDLYKYVDNNYIRFFFDQIEATMDRYKITLLSAMTSSIKSVCRIDFAYVLLFIPLFLIRLDRHKIFFIFGTIVVTLTIEFLLNSNERAKLYYIYCLIVLQIGIINDFMLVSSRKVIDRFVKGKKAYYLKAVIILLVLSYVVFEAFPTNFKIRSYKWVSILDGRIDWLINGVPGVFFGKKSKYQYLHYPYTVGHTLGLSIAEYPHKNFNHSMLIRQYTDVEDTILIVPVRFHSHAMRHITARHALGSVIYQKDISKIMADLKRLNISYLSYVPIHYKDYNPFYTPIFEDDTFYKYFKLIFSDNGCKFYKIIYDGTNEEYTSTPYDVRGLPFVPMIKEDGLGQI